MSPMPNVCREVFDDVVLGTGQNAALLLARYLKKDDAKGEVLNAVASAAGCGMGKNAGFYKSAFDRRGKILGGEVGIFKLAGRMIIGFGMSNVLETGLTLNPVYGTPLVPGSALKGLAAHYCSEVWGKSDKNFKKTVGEHHRFMFGNTEDAGFIVFNDAWITPSSLSGSLVRDVITPHHNAYYMSPQGGRSAPTDFDSPVPVAFLSVKGEFEIRVNFDSGSEAWGDLAMELLKQALENWGVGGKTNSGYGIGTLTRASNTGSISIGR
jgi:CRISPR-associated protein Cmr6